MQETSTIDDLRELRRSNDGRARIVVILFFLSYVVIGFLIDLFVLKFVYGIPLNQTYSILFSFDIFPLATTIMFTLAALSFLVCCKYYHKLILMDMKYHEIICNKNLTLKEQQLYNIVKKMMGAAGLRYMPKVYLIDTWDMNALACGYSEKFSMVAFTHGLVKNLDKHELHAVVAHELTHIRCHDIKLMLFTTLLPRVLSMLVNPLFRNMRYYRRRQHKVIAIIIMTIAMLQFFLPIITLFFHVYIKPTREYRADASAVKLIQDNEPMARALYKIDRYYKTNSRADKGNHEVLINEHARRPMYIYNPASIGLKNEINPVGSFVTHPPINDRLHALGYTRKEIVEAVLLAMR